MKIQRLILLLLCSTWALTTNAQKLDTRYPLGDAVQFSAYIKNPKDYDKAKTILKRYIPLKDLSQWVGSSLITIPSEIIGAGITSASESELSLGSAQSGAGSSLGAPGMIDEIGKLIADRFREELTLAFLDNFRQKIENDSLLKEVFPNTSRVLLYDDPFNYESWLASFRGAMNEDLQDLPENFPALIGGIAAKVDEDGKYTATIQAVTAIYSRVIGYIEHPEKSYTNTEDLMSYLDTEFSDSGAGKVISVLKPFVTEMGNRGYNDWADKDLIEQMEKPEILSIFIVFTVMKYQDSLKETDIKTGSNSRNMIEWAQEDEGADNSEFSAVIQKLMREVQEIQQAVKEIKEVKRKKGSLSFGDYANLIDESISLVSTLTDSAVLKSIDSNIEISATFKEAVDAIHTAAPIAIELNEAISAKEYTKLLPITLEALETFIPSETLESNIFLKDFLKYGNLAVSLSTATTSEEFASVLRGAVLPAQSYRLKRNSHFSITANAYAGIFGGVELLEKSNVENPISGITGFTAPIGIGLNWAVGKKDKPSKYSKYPVKTVLFKTDRKSDVVDSIVREKYFGRQSLSLLFTFVDVGAIAAFRLQDDESPAANVQWKNILAPGCYFVWGIGNTPLALNIGGQFGPELRSVKATDGATETVIESRAWRFGAGLTVDIPLFNFYSRSEKVVTKKSKPSKKAKK